jgi:hypothetical protein
MRLKTVDDIPEDWKVLTVRKKSTVKIRESNGIEKFKVSWSESELVSDPTLDFIVIQEDGTEYPCKKDIFLVTYESDSDDLSEQWVNMIWKKSGTSRIVEIPIGLDLVIETLEGDVGPVSYPDYIAIGVEGELYPNKKAWVEKNLEIL